MDTLMPMIGLKTKRTKGGLPRWLAYLAAAALVFLPGALRAQLLEYEGFEYTGTALDQQNGGSGWGGNAWADADADAPLSNDGASLAFPAIISFPPAGARLSFTGAGEAERRLGTGMPLTVENATYFFSALVRRQGSFRFEFLDDSNNVRWRFGAAGTGGTNTAVVGVGNDVLAANVFPRNETVLVVAKILARASVNDTAYLSVYRQAEGIPESEPATWQASGGSGSGVTLTRLQIRNLDNLPLEIDEIRIGRTYRDVVSLTATAPIIMRQPEAAQAYAGALAWMSVEAAGGQPLFYQWLKDGQPVQDQTNSALVILNATSADAGLYSVIVSNSLGFTNSTAVPLTILLVTGLETGLQAFWRLDETSGVTAYDATANANHGVLVGSPVWTSGQTNGGLQFNGANYVEVPDSPSLGAKVVNGLSVAAWFKSNVPLNTNGNTYRMLEKGDCYFFLQGDGNVNNVGVGGMNFALKRNNQVQTASIFQPLEANRWYHLAGTYDGQTLRVYLDGELKGTRAMTAPMDDDHLPLRIGSDDSGKYFNGIMDEVGVWARPLSAEEVMTLAGRNGPPQIGSQPAALSRYEGATADFAVAATGQSPMAYQWYLGTNSLAGATNPTLWVAGVQAADAGEYRCWISNQLGGVWSEPALLSVLPVTSLTNALQARWHLDEFGGLTAADDSGQGRDWQLLDYPDEWNHWIGGQVDGGLNFDGVASRAQALNTEGLSFHLDATIAFWINPSSYGAFESSGQYNRQRSVIARKGGLLDLQLSDDPGLVRQTLMANGVSAPAGSVALNVWQHWAIVFRAGTVTFYKNGFRLADSIPLSLGPANTNLLLIGHQMAGGYPTNRLAAVLDEMAIWDRPLSEAEILELALLDAAGPPVIVTTPLSANRYVSGVVEFHVEATGQRPVSYQWFHDGAVIPDAVTNRLMLTNLSLADAGAYTVVVQNSLGAATSSPPALLVVRQPTNITDGLSAYWNFDETEGSTLQDASGRGHPATLVNAAAAPEVAGLVGGAFDFDGVDDLAIVPHHPDFDMTDQFSFAVWVNPRSHGVIGTMCRILRKESNFDFTLAAGVNTLRAYGDNKVVYNAPDNAVILNQWQHLAAVFKNGILQFYRNGAPLGAPLAARFGPVNTNDLIIGNFGPDLSVNRVFSGRMDELGLWRRALSGAELAALYVNGLQGRALTSQPLPLALHSAVLTPESNLRLIFSGGTTNLPMIIQQTTSLANPVWSNVSGATVTPLGNGQFEALFARPPETQAFYRLALP